MDRFIENSVSVHMGVVSKGRLGRPEILRQGLLVLDWFELRKTVENWNRMKIYLGK